MTAEWQLPASVAHLQNKDKALTNEPYGAPKEPYFCLPNCHT